MATKRKHPIPAPGETRGYARTPWWLEDEEPVTHVRKSEPPNTAPAPCRKCGEMILVAYNSQAIPKLVELKPGGPLEVSFVLGEAYVEVTETPYGERTEPIYYTTHRHQLESHLLNKAQKPNHYRYEDDT